MDPTLDAGVLFYAVPASGEGTGFATLSQWGIAALEALTKRKRKRPPEAGVR
jgi:hypothetical protein